MAVYKDVLTYSWPASGDLSSYQYHAVYLNSSGKLAVANATSKAVGILQNKPDAADEAGSVMLLGISKAVVDANSTNITYGDWLKPNASGHLVKMTNTSSADKYAVAIALEPSTADGDIISVFVMPYGIRPGVS